MRGLISARCFASESEVGVRYIAAVKLFGQILLALFSVLISDLARSLLRGADVNLVAIVFQIEALFVVVFDAPELVLTSFQALIDVEGLGGL